MAAKKFTRVAPHICVTCGALFTPLKWKKAEGVFRAYTGRHNCSAECAYKDKGARTKSRMAATRDQWIGPANPMWTGACLRRNKSYRGPDWPQIAEAARSRDRYCCANCGMTQADHLSRWGRVLEVHHKVPFTEFTDHREANRPGNLTTLCKVCHMKADRAVPQRQTLIAWEDEPRKKSKEGIQRGANNGRAQLVEAQVTEVKRRLLLKHRQQDIAADFGIKACAVSAISTGQTWKHVPWPK